MGDEARFSKSDIHATRVCQADAIVLRRSLATDLPAMKPAVKPWLLAKPLHGSLGEEIGQARWEYLTQDLSKVRYYGSETYFREGLFSLRRVLGEGFYPALHQHTAIVFKPDAVVARKIAPALAFLKDHDFDPVYARPFSYDRLSLREDWRYQLNQLTLERMRLNTILAGMGDALLIMLRDNAPARIIPASVRLQMMKGPSFPERQTPKHLRYVLGSWSRLLKYVHTPDEPADIVRELGIVFEDADRQGILRATFDTSVRDGKRQVFKVIQALEEEHPYTSLDFDTSAERLLSYHHGLAEKGEKHRGFFERLKATIDGGEKGEKLDWFAFEDALSALGERITWDHIVLAAKYLHHSYEYEQPLIPNVGVAIWAERDDLLQV